MRQRSSWSWSRPTPHIYAYNREYAKLSAASEATSRSETSRRATRATSVLATEQSSSLARSTRAMSADAFAGYTGFYGRQLALLNKSSSSSASASASSAIFICLCLSCFFHCCSKNQSNLSCSFLSQCLQVLSFSVSHQGDQKLRVCLRGKEDGSGF